mgnify:CR=1 FL=1
MDPIQLNLQKEKSKYSLDKICVELWGGALHFSKEVVQ